MQLCFNLKVSSLTHSTPFSLMLGRAMNPFMDYTAIDPTTPPLDHADWKSYQEKIISLVYPAISEAVGIRQSQMVKRLNETRRQLTSDAFPNGSTVMLLDPVRQNKFQPKYIGPYTIIRRTRHGSYQLRDATGDNLDRPVPADQLKMVSKKPRAIDIANEVFRVEKILSHRGTAGKYTYQVKWFGFPETTWEPATSFLDDEIITKYWKNPTCDADISAPPVSVPTTVTVPTPTVPSPSPSVLVTTPTVPTTTTTNVTTTTLPTAASTTSSLPPGYSTRSKKVSFKVPAA